MNTYKIFEFKGLCQIRWNLVAKSGAGKLFCKGSDSVSGFPGHRVSAAAPQLCQHSHETLWTLKLYGHWILHLVIMYHKILFFDFVQPFKNKILFNHLKMWKLFLASGSSSCSLLTPANTVKSGVDENNNNLPMNWFFKCQW